MKKSTIIKYCNGCGACVSEGKATFAINERGFKEAVPTSRDFREYCNKVCFSSGRQYKDKKESNIWGEILSSHYSWATNTSVRMSGSSGGTLTALCIYLLKSGQVDGIVHTMEDPHNPIETLTVISRTESEVAAHTGSRYSSSSPILHISDYIEDGCKYCFVGKPCDVAALRNMMYNDQRYRESFKFLFSFFCAGVPSIHANELLLNKMGTSKDKCISLRYRGDGWPGFATAVDADGTIHKLDYRSVWRDTLGRDIRPICRFCIDGIGEMADIVCFDAWYMGDDKKPLFKEAEGRNGVFCRSKEGLRVFIEACNAGYIEASDYSGYVDELRYIQKYQYTRRTTMPSTLLAMKLLFKSTPSYPFAFMMSLMRSSTIKSNVIRFLGTIKRVLKGRIY